VSSVRGTVADAIPLHRIGTDLRRLLHTALEALHDQAQTHDIGLTVSVDSDVPADVPVDRAKIAWAIAALVGNALRYARHGSNTMPGGSVAVRVSCDAGAREIAIEVQDDGPGIPADRLQALFEREHQVPGLGLALSMVRDVVVAHGGRLAIDSHTNGLLRGTTVRVTLPVGE
jgi:signal transduction histidine kinase